MQGILYYTLVNNSIQYFIYLAKGDNMNEKVFMTIREVAKTGILSEHTIRMMVKAGEVPQELIVVLVRQSDMHLPVTKLLFQRKKTESHHLNSSISQGERQSRFIEKLLTE